MTNRVEYRDVFALREGDKITCGSVAEGERPEQVVLVIQIGGGEFVLDPDWLAEQEESAGHRRTWRHFLLRTVGLPFSVARRLFVALPPLYALTSDEALVEHVQWIAAERIKVAGIGSKTAEALREHLVEKGFLDSENIDNS